MKQKSSNGLRGRGSRGRPSQATAQDGLVALCEEWVALLRRRRASPARVRKAAARLRALAREVRAGKQAAPSDEELREIAGVLASISPSAQRNSEGEDEAAIARRGLLAWTESAAPEDWSAYYPPSLRKVRKAQ
ncbi:MAG: hypothetical protein IT450_21015 [Phycisphaerales bacterium]|nr:hypothetical protein [Phycisphaerales bacterium]